MSAPRAAPARRRYDVVIVGGAIFGASVAFFLTRNPDFDGTILVVERDPSYAESATARTNSCMRQQFSTEINVRCSQFAAAFVKDFPAQMGDARAPALSINSFGYLYLARDEGFAAILRENCAMQRAAGAATELLTQAEIADAYPFYALDDIVLGSINRVDEGYFDGATIFDWQRRLSRDRGAEYCANEVVGMTRSPTGSRIESVSLASGEVVACGMVVNASGARAAHIAAMAGLDLPVEPRKRFTWVFRAETPLDRPLPLTIDPTGVHVHDNGGGTYLAGGHAAVDEAADPDDFTMDPTLWEDHVWPALAARIPAFEAIRVMREWAGHYAYNVFDRNAVLGPHPEISNFLFLNGFSGHGLQQSPAMGRGLAEWIVYGGYRSLDLTAFGYDRIAKGAPLVERAVI